MVAEFPALPFYTDAYLADTRHLTTEEHGAYLLLLMCAWRSRGCALKDNDRQLARIVGMSPTRWRRLRPALEEFFDIKDNLWRQKKLTATHAAVAERVAKNRQNGSKGGRAAARKHKPDGFEPGWEHVQAATKAEESNLGIKEAGATRRSEKTATATANAAATKPKAKTKSSSSSPVGAGAQAVGQDVADVAAAAGLDPLHLDRETLELWASAGADLQADVLPTLVRIAERELRKSGALPKRLAYYTSAVLEARDKRVGAGKAGAGYAARNPAAKPTEPFDRTRLDHWRRFLGDAGSRFRGDYLSQNWRIPPGHPEFREASLGPDPKARPNPLIPKEIYETYGPKWGWQMPAHQNSETGQKA